MAMSNEYPDIVPISLETTESLLGYIFVDDSNVISSFASLKATQTSPVELMQKTDSTIKWHLKVIQGHAIRSLESRQGTALALALKCSADMATKSSKTRRFEHPIVVRGPSPVTTETTRICTCSLRCLKVESVLHGLHFCCGQYGSILSDFRGELQKTHYSDAKYPFV